MNRCVPILRTAGGRTSCKAGCDPGRRRLYANRVRHAIRTHIISYVRPDGSFVARKMECFSNQGAYASHGHSIAAKGLGAFPAALSLPECGG